jgi:hypothetical protein
MPLIWGARQVSRSVARTLIENFMTSRRSIHSAQHGTLWVIITYCEEQQIPYRIIAHPGMGYEVERL